MQPHDLTLTEAAAALKSRDLSPVELVDSCLARTDSVEGRVGAFITVVYEEARMEAKRAEREILNGRYRGPLHGIPLAVKDNFDTAGVLTTCSSDQRATHVPDEDAAVVAELRRGGSILIGKTRSDEFAFGGVTPGTSNPWDTTRIAGGSSGGSAAAIAAGESLLAVGTDTGGSIRLPSSMCGVVGLKPTYGLLSRQGIAPLSWSLDHPGPIARTVTDAALGLEALLGHDASGDPAAAHSPTSRPMVGLDRGVDGLVVGVPTNYFFDRIDPSVEARFREAVSRLEAEGARVRDVEVPLPDLYLAVEWGILIPEASSADHQRTLRESPERYGEELRSFLQAGELILATDYIRALRARTLIKQAWKAMFDDHQLDVVLSPTLPITAPLTGEDTVAWPDGAEEPLMPLLGRSACPANVTGLPAMSVPCGLDAKGLPVGLEIVGRPFAEETVVRVGSAYERVSEWSAPASTVIS